MTKPTTTTSDTLAGDDVADAELIDPESSNLPAVPDGNGGIEPHDDKRILSLLPADDEWADIDDGDLAPTPGRIPHLGLNRNVDGGFVNPETGEKTQTIDFVWLAKGRSRAWFKDPFGKGDSVPSCRSFDGIVADPSSPDMQNGGDCNTCPHAQWGADGDKPSCRESIEALVFLPDPHAAGHLTRIRWSGIAVRPARLFWDSFQTRLPRRPPMAYVSRATLEPTSTDFGDKLAPRFERVAEISRNEAQPLIEERDRRLVDWQADIAETVATATIDDLHDDQPGQQQPDTTEEPF